MGEGTEFLIVLTVILFIALLITISTTIYEKLETPYDKCLDKCSGIATNQQDIDCITACNSILNCETNKNG